MSDNERTTETPMCERHGGPWGSDETCERCTDEGGNPRPVAS